MKLREFWIGAAGKITGRPSGNYDDMLHVREVSPELDAAYAECERALRECLENASVDNPSKSTCMDALISVVELSETALAALKRARGE